MYNNIPQQQGYNAPYYLNTPYSGYNLSPQQYQYQRQSSEIPTSVPLNYIKGRPVSSIDEAKASQIDLDGSLNIFPDLSNKKIYTKQINLDGTASFNIYELNNNQQMQTSENNVQEEKNYITKTELDTILQQYKEDILNMIKTSPPTIAKQQPIINL